MTESAQQVPPDNAVALSDPKAGTSPEEREKQRLKFELELLQSQRAGAALDPLLRPARKAGPQPDSV